MTSSAQPEGKKPPTMDEIKGWPATVSIPKAGEAWNMSRNRAYELAKSGKFPATVTKVGRRYRVITESIVRALSDQTRD